jgi:hypothetical protein
VKMQSSVNGVNSLGYFDHLAGIQNYDTGHQIFGIVIKGKVYTGFMYLFHIFDWSKRWPIRIPAVRLCIPIYNI